jgi:hypothetical protein
MEREQLEAAAVDLDVQLIDRHIAAKYPIHQLTVPLDQGLERRPDPILGKPAHLEQSGLELFQLVLKMGYETIGHFAS